MNARTWSLAAALGLLASVAGCKKDDGGHSPTPAGPSITVSASTSTVVANGSNTVALTVTDTGGAAVTVTTTRGTFSGGGTTATLPATAGATTGTLTLLTCNSASSAGCAGDAVVTASSTTGQATATIAFTALASACATNCAASTGCAGQACALAAGGSGTCSATSPSACTAAPACTKNPANATSETSAANGCHDGVDNDCNGKIDCEDTACDGQACDPASATSVCKSGKCTDLASGLAVTVTPARARMPANGTTTTTVVVAVTSGKDPAPNMAIGISATLGTLSATSGTTGKDGTVAFTFTAPATPGVAVITARPTAVPTVSASASVTIPRLGAFQVPSPSAVHPVMGVMTSGWNEFGGVLVQVLDDQGQPYPDGLAVHFEHRQLGGSTFAAPRATCAGTPAPASCVAYDAVTTSPAGKPDSAGLASAPLASGTVAGTLVVTATTTAQGGGETRAVTLPGIAVVGAKASATNFSIQCSPRNLPALAESDCSTSWVDAPFTCVALLKDRFGNLLGTSTQVIFVSEAAGVGPVTWTPAYDPTTPGNTQPDLGSATEIFQTLGAGLPFDVDPQANEQFVDHALDGCTLAGGLPRRHNPRDGVVTIIAIADGEEGFFDANGNGQHDAATASATGEPFVDQGEPFVDQNDNGAYDPGEWFLDVNGNRVYDGPNGVWDAQAKIWTQTVVVYTGAAAVMVQKSAGPPATFLASRWVAGFTDACTATPAAPAFSVNAKRTGPPEVPPTSVGRVVVASDMNLNFLTSKTAYGVKVESPGKVVPTYLGLASYADMLGLFYQYWPCDTAGNCASQCRAAVPQLGAPASGTGPCVMTPALSDFGCGVAAGVTIRGGEQPDGTNFVDFTIDVPWDVYLGAKIEHAVVTTSGTNN